jgi:hypothetical protein
MSDDVTPQSAPPSAPSSSVSDEHAARIEQLLMAGLDEYFAGRHDRAVQVWSRVFFLDRTNARARAYIERARGAFAERQRLAEAALATSTPDPDVDGPRAPRDEGRAMSDLRPSGEGDGLLVVSGALAARLSPPEPEPAVVPAISPASRRARIAHTLLVAAAGLLLFVAGYTVAARDRLAEWVNGVTARPTAPPATEPRASEIALNDARQALAARRFDDARRALARIPADDPLRHQADGILGDLQRAWPVVSPMLGPDVPVTPAPLLPPAGAGPAAPKPEGRTRAPR